MSDSEELDLSTTSQIEFLKNQRSGIKGRITYFKNQIDKKRSIITQSELTSIHNRLTSIYTKFDTTQSELEQLDKTQRDPTIRDSFEDDYGALESLILELIKIRRETAITVPNYSVSVASTPTSQQANTITQLAAVKLPDIKLPSFSGEYEDWLRFRTSYLDLIHNNTVLSKATKYHYLLACLNEGKAHHLVSTMPISEDNYDSAWAALVKEYDNESRIVRKHMQNIYELPLVQEN